MIFLHILADFNLQGFMAQAKQKEYWKINAPDEMYKFDYIVVLLLHSFMWSFMIMIPIALYFGICTLTIVLFFLNIILHAIIDNEKANRKTINLNTDQIFHIIQIILTYLIVII